MLLNICRMDKLRFGHERPTDSDCCLICTCLSVRILKTQSITRTHTYNRIVSSSFNCVIVKCLVVHSLGDISCVCLACLVPQNLKQSATTPVLHWKKKKIPFSFYSLEGVSESVIIGPLLEVPMLTSGSAVTRSEV
jgi:hypothetical protein